MTLAGIQDRQYFAIVPAAGVGRRMKAPLPKQYLDLAGRTVLEHTLSALLKQTYLHTIVVALAAGDQRGQTLPVLQHPRIQIAQGGARRIDSVLNGLRYLCQQRYCRDNDWILVHDAARPCIQSAAIQRLVDTLATDPVGGLLAIPISDTVKRVDEHRHVLTTVDRQHLWRAQTPQLFRCKLLLTALTRAVEQDVPVTDEASAMEAIGKQPTVVIGCENNIKITCPADLALAAYYLQEDNNTLG